MASKKTQPSQEPNLITGTEAALLLGVTFGRFKVAIGRGVGAKSLASRKPHGSEAKPVQGGWSGKNSLYRREDIERMRREYPWKVERPLDTPEKVEADKARTLTITLEPWVFACIDHMVDQVNSQSLEQGFEPSMDVRGLIQSWIRRDLLKSKLVDLPHIKELMGKSPFGRKALASRKSG